MMANFAVKFGRLPEKASCNFKSRNSIQIRNTCLHLGKETHNYIQLQIDDRYFG
jgi:hypothetical protein